jgi:hypothetical protein
MQAEDYFNKIISDIPDGTPGKMFGALCLKLPNGKAAAMFKNDCLVVKLPEKLFNEALALKGAKLFDPAGGRPIKESVEIPFIHKNKWNEYLKASAKNTAALTAVKSKKKS